MGDDADGRPPALGGWGKEAMLTVRRKDFSGLPGVRPLDPDRAALRFEVEFELERGDRARDGLGLDGVRNLDGWYGDVARGVSAAEVLFLDLGFGSGGNAPVGGLDGREGCGSADVEAIMSTGSIQLCRWGCNGHAGGLRCGKGLSDPKEINGEGKRDQNNILC